MLATAVRSLIGRFARHPTDEAAAALVPVIAEASPAAAAASEPHVAWPPARIALAHQLWGPGFIFPGGEIETLRLARPLGASDATSLLMIGIGSGGPASVVARNMGTWVTGLEADPSLLAAARILVKRAQLAKKVSVKPWDPSDPGFVPRSHHHCLALEPLLSARPEPILSSLAQALRPGGQLVMTELAAVTPLDATDPTIRRWAALEGRNPAEVPLGVSVTRMLGRVGLDVRIAEDISSRHLEHAMLGWRILLQDLRDRKPTHGEAVRLVAEAEMWLLRRRLIREGRLQMMRWHALTRASIT